MDSSRLSVLLVSPMAPSPPRFGAQARTHGLLTYLAKDHDLTALVLHDDDETPALSGPAMRAYCREVTFVRNPNGATGWRRRALQLRSWLSSRSYQRHLFAVPAFQAALDRALGGRRFDVVFVNLPYLAHYRLRHGQPGTPEPAVVIDSHDVGYDLARQIAASAVSFGRLRCAGLSVTEPIVREVWEVHEHDIEAAAAESAVERRLERGHGEQVALIAAAR